MAGENEKQGMSRSRRRVLLLVTVGVLVAGAATAIATQIDPTVGTSQTGVTVRYQQKAANTTSPAFQTVPGAVVRFAVPRHSSRLVIVRFSATSNCSSGAAGDECGVRVVYDGNHLANPLFVYRFDSHAGTDPQTGHASNVRDYGESHAMERSFRVGPGSHIVEVQYRAFGGEGAEFYLYGWHLSVERSAAPTAD